MPIEQKIGQMFMARGLKFFPDETADMIEKGLIGGMHVRDNDTAEEVKTAQELSPIPMFMATDMESGFCGANFGGTRFGFQMGLGALACEKTAYEFGEAGAREAKAFGVNFVFGPVVDVANEPASPFVNIRAFSSNPAETARLAAAVVRGYQDNGMIVSAKHYPGAGRASVDNHIEPIILECSPDEFSNVELFVYRELIKKAELSGVMSGHIAVRHLDGENIATLSAKITAPLFEMGFKGLLITDSLAMKGIKGSASSEEIFVKALQAGHNIILGDYNLSPREQFNYMFNAVKNGDISEEQVDRSAAKVLAAKNRIFSMNPPLPDKVAIQLAAKGFTTKSVTISGDVAQIEKFRSGRNLIVVAREKLPPAVIGEITMESEDSDISGILNQNFPHCEVAEISDIPSPAEIEQTLDKALDYDFILVVAFAKIHSYKGTADFSNQLLALVRGIRKRIKIFAVIGNPFAARELPESPCRMFIFDQTETGEQALVKVLSGQAEAKGKLPISW